MKKFYFALAAVAAILAGCSKEVDNLKPEPVTPGEKTVSLKASVGDPQTKVSSDNAGVFKWQDTDKITILTNNGNVRQFTIGEITDGTSAEFSGTIPDAEGETIKYALYPASTSHFTDGTDNILFHIDDQVIWDADASNMPMLAKVGGSATSFKAVGGVLKLILFNISDDADYLKFSATNKQISGDFEIADASISAPVIATAEKKGNNNEQVIDFSANYSSSKVFYIPLPTGTIDGFTVSLLDDTSKELFSVTSEKELNVAANKLIIAPVMNCAPTDVLWSEDFSSYSANDVPSGGTYSYACVDGGSDTKIYNEKLAGGSAPELLVGKSSGSFTASVPTNDAGTLTLKYKTNANELALSSTTEGVSFSPASTSTAAEHTITITNSKNASSISITFAASSSKNVRLDDILLTARDGIVAPVINTGDVSALTIALGETSVSTPVSLSGAVDGLGISAILSGTNADKFTASIAEGNLTVTAVDGANNSEDAYTATVTLKASGATSKVITVTQESALVPNPTDLAAVAGNATVDITWTGDANATSYVAYLHTAATETPASGGTNISESITHDGQAYIIDDYTSVVNDQTYYVYVKVNGVEEGYVAPTDYVVASFTPAVAKGTAENPYLASELYDLVRTYDSGKGPEGTIYVKGYVSKAYNPSSNAQTYFISDDGTTTTEFEAYKGKGISGADITDANCVNVGDWVVVAGIAVNYNGDTPEFNAGSEIITHNPKLAAPTFDPEAGTYYSAQSVVISATNGATIYYTTDGTEPTIGSTAYTEPIAVSADWTIKAIAVKENFVTSAVAVAAYDIEAPEKLSAPTITVHSFNHNSITFSWEAIEHATGYQVSIDGGTNWLAKQEELTYTWTGLEANTSYTVKVKAIGTDNGQYTDSDVASKSQTTAAPKTLVSIALTTDPTKTTYNVNEAFSLAGAVVTATYSDESTADVTASCTTEYDFSTTGNKTVTISYTEGVNTRTCECNVTVAIVDVLTNSTTGISGTAYTAWSGKSKTTPDSGINSNAVYAGQSAGGNNSSGPCIQLRSSNSNSGIITTTSGGYVRKITVIWNDETADARSLDIYGKNSAYSEATELYNNSNQGTKLGSIVKGTSTELTIDDDYEFVGLRSNSNAMYIDEIRIQWAEGTPSIAMAKTAITNVAAAGVTNNSESGVYTFKNGATDADVTVTCDGAIVTAATKNNGSITYSVAANTGAARDGWIKVKYGSEDPHTVTVSQLAPTFTLTLTSGGNGTVAATVDEAAVASGSAVAVGKTVSITTTPSSGYQLSALSYNDGSAHDIISTKSFTMPAHAVTVTATFSAIPTISMNKTSITNVSADGVTNASESGVYIFHNGATDADVKVTCDGTIVTAAAKNNGAITYSVSANTSAARNGWIKVQYGSEDPHTVTVSQLAGAVEPTLQYTLDGTITAAGNAYATATNLTQNQIAWSVMGNTEMNPWRIGGKSITNEDRALYSKTAIASNISKIEVKSGTEMSSLTVNSMTITVHSSAADAASGSNAIATKTVTSGIANSTVTFNKADNTSWAGKYYRIVYNVTRTSNSGNGYITFESAKFYGTAN